MFVSDSASKSTKHSKNTAEEVNITMNYSTFLNISGREKVEKFSQITEITSRESVSYFHISNFKFFKFHITVLFVGVFSERYGTK